LGKMKELETSSDAKYESFLNEFSLFAQKRNKEKVDIEMSLKKMEVICNEAESFRKF